MSRLLFNHPFLLGFDSVSQTLEKLSKCSDNYPPYNIEQYDNNVLVIKIAVAGFEVEDLSVYQENNELIIVGEKKYKDVNVEYLHQGISCRKFQKVFVLAEEVIPVSSHVKNGLLVIHLKREVIQKDVKIIAIEDHN
ncbi:MAG: Hsp20 family protein [Alphaproteobacteria bacterium]|jgi:HSP20 family molecular chaperone IbpA|nr:Hsp20 family protein [Alphaproteobacteria bacterium]